MTRRKKRPRPGPRKKEYTPTDIRDLATMIQLRVDRLLEVAIAMEKAKIATLNIDGHASLSKRGFPAFDKFTINAMRELSNAGIFLRGFDR